MTVTVVYRVGGQRACCRYGCIWPPCRHPAAPVGYVAMDMGTGRSAGPCESADGARAALDAIRCPLTPLESGPPTAVTPGT